MTDLNQTKEQELDQLLNRLLGAFEEKMPFNKLLGIKIESLHLQEVRLRINMREELVGNFVHGILHGGVIASVLDVAGGMIAIANAFSTKKQLTEAERMQGIDKSGTIDMRIDYLRPGRGKYFIATAQVLRSGRKVSVTRMELHNDKNLLIAVGTGSYIVG
ncbi:thioesterase family protein [Candidatus Albibeggiatoa sp. nov. BB20]|uniref:thioesterase family protein n=1 Tax=Candidatus Albibeggiatoa sp. nov. BB20 TaxID=3162723 RepID=UPI0033655338